MLFHTMFPHILMAEDEGGAGTSGGTTPPAVSVDWTKIDPNSIPKDVIEKSTVYSTVIQDKEKIKQEAINRRLTNKELRDQLSQVLGDKTEPTGEDQNKPKETPAESSKLEKLVEELALQLGKITTNNITSWRKQAMEATGLTSEDIMSNISGDTYEQVLAKAQKIATDLKIAPPVRRTGGSVGNPTQERSKSFQEEVRKKMFGGQTKTTFGTDLQSALGGGVVDINRE